MGKKAGGKRAKNQGERPGVRRAASGLPWTALLIAASLPAVVAAVAFGSHANTLLNDVVYDDLYLTLKNPWIREWTNIPKLLFSPLWSFEFDAPQSYYRPVVHLLYMADYYLFGLEPWGFHLSRVALHTVSSVLVFFTALTLSLRARGATEPEPKDRAFAFFSALLFATNPVHTEVNVISVAETTLGIFFFLALFVYIRGNGRGAVTLGVSAASFFLAALCKETALMLVPLLLAYDYTFKRDTVLPVSAAKLKGLALRYSPFAAATVVYFIMRYNALEGFIPYKHHSALSTYELLINAPPHFAGYIWKLLVPVNLNAAYVFDPARSVFDATVVFSLIIAAVFVAAVYISRKRSPLVFFSLLWFALPLVPALYIPALGEHTFAERYMYLPGAGFAMLSSMAVIYLVRQTVADDKRALSLSAVVVAVVTVVFTIGSIKRTAVWRDEHTLWLHTARASPTSHMARNNLATTYDQRGMTEEAIEEYRASLKIKPDYLKARVNLGLVYHRAAVRDEAEAQYREAIKISPRNAGARASLGLLLYETGRVDEAIEEYKISLGLRGDVATVHLNLGLALYAKGMRSEAAAEYRIALSIDPNLPEAHNNLGILMEEAGRGDEAEKMYMRAAQLNPRFPAARYNLGRALKKRGLIGEAKREFEAALTLNPDFGAAKKELDALTK